jgi:peroxiredoxin Q/BCP
MLETGTQAPDFTLTGVTASGEERSYHLQELLADGKPVILYFYPKDDTPGCTTEACDFRDRWPAKQDGAHVLGVSADSLTSHRKFQTKHGLNFPLLSDPDHQVMEAYGAWGEKTLYGKKSVGVIRSTFVIAPDMTVRKAFRHVKVAGHAEKVLDLV